MRRICGWCGTPNVGDRTNCVNCGGPLPAPPGADPGPAPDPAPRSLPGKYTRKLYLNFMVLFGAIFGGTGALITVGFGLAAVFGDLPIFPACFGSFFLAFGSVFAYIGVQNARSSIRVLKSGRPAAGRVSGVQQSGGIWTLAYLFEVDGDTLAGSLQTEDPIVSQYHEGDALHVVYDPADPSTSSLWPPIRLEL